MFIGHSEIVAFLLHRSNARKPAPLLANPIKPQAVEPLPSRLLRATVLSKGRKARLGDALIAQTCLDQNIPLLTRDKDFRAFADAAQLHLVL
jgi:predicted nucleic acid-binding protein